jgi:hypothetical protein
VHFLESCRLETEQRYFAEHLSAYASESSFLFVVYLAPAIALETTTLKAESFASMKNREISRI